LSWRFVGEARAKLHASIPRVKQTTEGIESPLGKQFVKGL